MRDHRREYRRVRYPALDVGYLLICVALKYQITIRRYFITSTVIPF